MASVPFHPLKGDVTAVELFINGLEEVPVEYRLAVTFAPSMTFPSRNPLRAAVNGVLRVTQDRQWLVGVTSGAQHVENGLELTHVIRTA